jgi:hypothetical protein
MVQGETTQKMKYKDIAKQLGKRGGQKTFELHGMAHIKRISKLGVIAR